MRPGSNSALYVAVGGVVLIVVIVFGVRAAAPPKKDKSEAAASASAGLLNLGLPPGSASADPGGYQVIDARPIMIAGKRTLLVSYLVSGTEEGDNLSAAKSIFRGVKAQAESHKIEAVVVSSVAPDPLRPGKMTAGPGPNVVFERGDDGTWARVEIPDPEAPASADAPSPPSSVPDLP